MRNLNRPTSDRVLEILRNAGINWCKLYREPRKGARFIDGYSFKLHCCGSDPVTVQKLLERNGVSGVFVRRVQSWNWSRPGIAITWEG